MKKLFIKQLKAGHTNGQVKIMRNLLLKMVSQVSDKKHIQNQKGILTQTNRDGILGAYKNHCQNKKGILTLSNLNGLLSSDQPGSQNSEPPHFSAAKPQVWMQRQCTMGDR